MARPNIVLICADDIGFNEIGLLQGRGLPDRDVFGGARVLTPHIDAIGRAGATLLRHYVPSAICTPARYSLLTGRFASRSPSIVQSFPPPRPATITWNTAIDPQEGTVGNVLQNLGYTTGFVGKWHNGEPKAELAAVAGIGDGRDPRLVAAVRESYARRVNYLRAGFGFDFVERVYFGNREGFPEPYQVHNLEWLCEGAEKFLDARAAEPSRPFYLHLAFSAPHGDYFNAPHRADPLLTPAGPLDAAPRTLMPPRESIEPRLAAAGVDAKTVMATWQDDCVGAVVEKLRRLGLDQNTIVIFTGDHLGRGKYMCYEGCRVPFLIRWPVGIPAGRELTRITSHIDLCATLAGFAGGAVPPDYVTDGADFSPLLTAPVDSATAAPAWRDQLLLECSNIRGLVTDRWKYIACRASADVLAALEADRLAAVAEGRPRWVGWEGKRNPHPQYRTEGVRYFDCGRFENYFAADQLYDLQADVFETRNLAGDPAHAQTLARMQAGLRAELAKLPHAFGEFTPANRRR
ncbi:MAG: sulfatase family protein [Planctomycetota bacterium]